METGKIEYFKSSLAFRKWLMKHQDNAREIWLGFYKTGLGKEGITYKEALDQALCFGWIDGIRKNAGSESYTIRFTPRRKNSIWSNVNTRRMEELICMGIVHPSGEKAYKGRDEKRAGIYSFEKEPVMLPPSYLKKFRANKEAWKYFVSRAPWYQRTCFHWIMNARQETTREKRLNTLINDSAAGKTIPAFTRK